MRGLLAWSFALIAAGAFSRPANSGKDSIGQRTRWNILPALGVQAKKLAVPNTTFTYFEHLPTKLHYFDDAKTAVYFDANVIYISEDEGMNWNVVDDIPGGEAFSFIPHPFDDRMAFVLSRNTTHYVTEDRGHTWRSFNVPLAPSRGPLSLAFHSDPQKAGYVLYHGHSCTFIFDPRCIVQTLYTKDAFATEPKVLLSPAMECIFAHSSKEFAPDAHSDLIFCIAKDSHNSPSETARLFASSDFFVDDRRAVDYGTGVIGMAVMSKFLAIAVQASGDGGLVLHVTVDCDNWVKAQFPHNADRLDYPFTLLGSGNRSILVDLQAHNSRRLGTLFTSNVNGTDFVEILRDTHRSEMGVIDFLDLPGVQGGDMINYVHNAREIDNGGWNAKPELKTLITYDDGTSWNSLTAPARDMHNNTYECHSAANNTETCSLHLHVFSERTSLETPLRPPGFIMAVGSVSKTLLDYEESDMYLSRDAGVSWKQVRRGAHKYAFGDQGNIIVLVDDEKPTDHLRYSIDSGESWRKLDLGLPIRATHLTTPAVTSRSFVLIGVLQRGDTEGRNRFAAIHLDFSYMQTRQCEDDDVEKWYAQAINGTNCIMGQKQWFWRKKSGVDCYMEDKYRDSVSDVEHCLCTDADYGCDYNYSRTGKKCVPITPEPIPAGACVEEDGTYQGSSGYRLLAGNTCKREGGVRKDEPITKDCTETPPDEGEVSHQTFTFASMLKSSHYFLGSKSILMQVWNGAIWQSTDEGYTWRELIPGPRFLLIYIHPYADERAYILTDAGYYYVTVDGGHSWSNVTSPVPADPYRSGSLAFHPKSFDYLIWTGEVDCQRYDEGEGNCHVESYLSLDHGGTWRLIEKYLSRCIFAETLTSTANEGGILCASYRDKSGPQYQYGSYPQNPLELIIGENWYDNKKILFDQIIGFDIFGDYLVVAALAPNTYALDLQISLAGNDFVPAKLPPGIQLRRRDFTRVLQSSPNSIFLQEGISGEHGTEWGTLLKSNANGTYYGVSLERVNGNMVHEIAYYRMPGVDGVARVNILTNPDEAVYTGKKKLQTRITHDDGGSWHPLKPPSRDSNGALYPCNDNTKCALHLHGPKYVFPFGEVQHLSSPTGLMLAVGNVGEFLAPREESDIFLTRNAGITWQEVHKDAHIWAFGDSGSILVIANHEQATDHVQYTTDHGLHWTEYNFGIDLRVETLTSDPKGSSRKFILTGWSPSVHGVKEPPASTVVYLNFAELNPRQCVLDINDPAHSDFEVWDPSEDRGECLLGAKMAHYRKKRSAKCYIGDLVIPPATVKDHCECTEADFECEFNHIRDSAGKCVLVPGAVSLSSENTCIGDDEFWYERTAYRKISKSVCENGNRLDQGTAHHCHSHWFRTFVSRFWWTLITPPVGIIALVAVWYYRRRGPRRGAIHLPDGDEVPDSLSPFRAKLASIPSVVAEGMAKFWNYLKSFPGISMSLFGSRRRTQEVALEDDA